MDDMRVIVSVFVLLAGQALAQDWQPLRGDTAIIDALADRTVEYDAHTFQRFGAAGDTQFVTERLSEGRWAVRGGQYCSVWPPSDIWACYDVQVSNDEVRFIGSDRSISQGQYRD